MDILQLIVLCEFMKFFTSIWGFTKNQAPILISILALGISFWQVYLSRKESYLSNRAYVTVLSWNVSSINYTDDYPYLFKFPIINIGNTPATKLVSRAYYIINGKKENEILLSDESTFLYPQQKFELNSSQTKDSVEKLVSSIDNKKINQNRFLLEIEFFDYQGKKHILSSKFIVHKFKGEITLTGGQILESN